MIIAIKYQVEVKTKAERHALAEKAKTSGFGYNDPTTGKEPTERELIQRLLKAKGEEVLWGEEK